jgi:uncharacterized membrane protein HdeD (DUF308 family)
MLLVGASLAGASVFNPGGSIMHAGDFSWLPLAAFVVLTVGLLECFDAFIAKELRDFFLHLQSGVLDVVVATLIIFSIGGHPDRLSLLLVAYLTVKATVRITLAHATQLPQKSSTLLGAAVSILLGLLMWVQWPSSDAWFLAFCLSTDIGLRGWSLMMFAFWLRARKPEAHAA